MRLSLCCQNAIKIPTTVASLLVLISCDYFFKCSLLDLFGKVDEEEKSPLSEIGQPDGSSLIQWQDARGALKAKIGDFWYLSGSECETSLEVIFSYEKERICLHYSATLHLPAFYETKITKYYLNDIECKLFEKLINHADEITDNTISELQENQIYGAEYW